MMMFTAESQVLLRHLALFAGKRVLFLGNIRDDFPFTCQQTAQQVRAVSGYVDYAQQAKLATTFAWQAEYQHEDYIVFYWGKNKQECQCQLQQILAQAPIGQKVLIVGENRSGVRSAEICCAALGEIAKIDSARRCSLYHFTLQHRPNFDEAKWWRQYRAEQLANLNICSLPGVFSSAELDHGTALLLSTFTQPLRGKVLDIGCGAGVIGVYLKKRYPNIDLTMTDISAAAILSAKETLRENQLVANVFASDVFAEISEKFDLIVSNPPFHSGLDTAYNMVENLIREAKNHLNLGGELRIVANAFLPYPDWLDRHFGSHRILAKTGKFKVYQVYSR